MLLYLIFIHEDFTSKEVALVLLKERLKQGIDENTAYKRALSFALFNLFLVWDDFVIFHFHPTRLLHLFCKLYKRSFKFFRAFLGVSIDSLSESVPGSNETLLEVFDNRL